MPSLDAAQRFQILTSAVLIGGFVWAWIETRISIRMAHRFDLLAPVTHRSAHRVPTPTIGGVAIVDTVLIAAIVLNLLYRPVDSLIYPAGVSASMANWVLILCGATMAIMGLVDDWRTVKPWPKLLIQIACALPPAWLMRHGAWIGEDTWGWLWGETVINPRITEINDTWMWMSFGFNFVWMMVVINIFNFMDGMDGLAGMFATVVAMVIGALVVLQAANRETLIALGEVFFLSLAIVGAVLGFLRLNLPPARTFMGDVGSQFLGWALATLALMAHVPLARTDEWTCLWPTSWAPLLLFLPFLGDGFFTMARRARRGENILTPHFTHLYQRLLTCGHSHARVLFVEVWIMAACGILTIALLLVRPAHQPLMGLAGLGLMFALWCHVRSVETRPRDEE